MIILRYFVSVKKKKKKKSQTRRWEDNFLTFFFFCILPFLRTFNYLKREVTLSPRKEQSFIFIYAQTIACLAYLAVFTFVRVSDISWYYQGKNHSHLKRIINKPRSFIRFIIYFSSKNFKNFKKRIISHGAYRWKIDVSRLIFFLLKKKILLLI